MGHDLAADVLPAADGYPLAVTRFPAQGPAWATLLIAPAMGVRQEFYAPLARFFAEQGIHVLAFDFRGMGASRPASLRGFPATVLDWMRQDLAAMLCHAQALAPSLPLLFVGHSLGGQLIGGLDGTTPVRAVLNVTAGSGYYRLNDRMPAQVRVFWFGAVPLLTPLFGYFPGQRLRMVGDLPAGVVRQWRRWCLHPDYLVSEGEAMRDAFAAFRAPIVSYSFADDSMITRAAVESLNRFFTNARIVHRHVTPADGDRIGHFGFFSPARRETLWTEALAGLRAAAA